MTQIQLDEVTADKIRNANGPVLLCDQTGQPIRIMYVDPFPNCEPTLSPEERKRRKEEPGAMSTAEFVAYLQSER